MASLLEAPIPDRPRHSYSIDRLSMANSHFRPALEVEISHDKVASNGTC
jgi:hypothetical protein